MGLRARSLCEDIALIRFPAGKHLSINRNHLSIDELNTVVTRIGPPRYFAGMEVFRETSVRVFRLYASRNELIDSAMSYGEMMHEAFRGGANAWLAYNWVYPPPKGGQSLIHVDWGKDYRLTKIYHLFRQWSRVLPWDSHVVESGQNGKLLANAFLTPDRDAIVVHVLNREEKSKKLQLAIRGGFASALARRLRTSPSEDCAEIADLKTARGVLRDTLPAKSLTTYRFERR